MADNRRQSERINIPLEIVLESASGRRECRISDLSFGGCFVDSIAAVSAGEVLTLMLHLPTRQCLKVQGEVTYLYPGFGFGLRFIDLSKEGEIQLEQVILAHGGKPLKRRDVVVEQETKSIEEIKPIGEITPVNENPEPKGSLTGTKSPPANEFEQLMQDLFDSSEEENESAPARKDSIR
jgi:hypothetical protein